jgi:hypothetical protein
MKEVGRTSPIPQRALLPASELKDESPITKTAQTALTLSLTPPTPLQKRLLEIAELNPAKATLLSQILQNPSLLRDTLVQLEELGLIRKQKTGRGSWV